MSTLHGDMKLGRISRPVPTNVPSLKDHAIARVTAPPRLDRSHVDFRPDMAGNDTVGDCTIALLANCIVAQAALYGFRVSITTKSALALYSAISGYKPGDPFTDTGCVETDVLAYQARHGFDVGQQAPYVGLWGNVPVTDLNLLRMVTLQFGLGYLGVGLAIADQQADVWDTNTPASYGDPTPSSWGGHAVGIFDWSGTGPTDTVRLATWGMLKKATWRWVQSRMEEAHGIVHPQLIGPSGATWRGIDREALLADVEAYSADA